MIPSILTLLRLLNLAFPARQALVLENLALRQQIAVYQRRSKRPRLRRSDRLFWLGLSRLWSGWRDALVIVQPRTVVGWHRKAFRRYWRWKSSCANRPPGRPPVSAAIRALIRRMKRANPIWGAPRIHGELLKLGIDIDERTVSRLLPKPVKPPSQTWRTFLENHACDLVSLDFFTVPTLGFRVLFVLVVLSHERRRVVHFNVTANPNAFWTAQQLLEAFPDDSAPRYLLRDRDGVSGTKLREQASALGIQEVRTAPRSPWQNPYAERVIGSICRECLDHVIVLNRRHLRSILKTYFSYYHQARTHLSLDKDAPEARERQNSELGDVVEFPEVGGLHHRYERRAA